MIRHAESHCDHVSPDVLAFVLEKYQDRKELFIETFELPETLYVTCALYGPIMGDRAITEDDSYDNYRGSRPYQSRLVPWPERKTRICTVVAGPHGDEPCVLYTVYGGPAAPKEVHDPALKPEEKAASERFWREHALGTIVL